MPLLLPGYAVTRGSALLAHRRFQHSPVTICGYRVARMLPEAGGRRICPRCVAFIGTTS